MDGGYGVGMGGGGGLRRAVVLTRATDGPVARCWLLRGKPAAAARCVRASCWVEGRGWRRATVCSGWWVRAKSVARGEEAERRLQNFTGSGGVPLAAFAPGNAISIRPKRDSMPESHRDGLGAMHRGVCVRH